MHRSHNTPRETVAIHSTLHHLTGTLPHAAADISTSLMRGYARPLNKARKEKARHQEARESHPLALARSQQTHPTRRPPPPHARRSPSGEGGASGGESGGEGGEGGGEGGEGGEGGAGGDGGQKPMLPQLL